MTKKKLFCVAALVALTTQAAVGQELPSDKSDTGPCSCVRNICNNACMRTPNPEVLAALRKRFPNLQSEDDVLVFDDGRQRYEVAFYTPKSHMACRFTLKPVRFTKCRVVHG
jgi:hypothetical protein